MVAQCVRQLSPSETNCRSTFSLSVSPPSKIHALSKQSISLFCGIRHSDNLRIVLSILFNFEDRRERNHKCGLCDTRFGQKSDLRRHIQVVHEQQKNFACVLCGRAFGRRSSLSQHMQRVHKRILPPLRDQARMSTNT